MNGNVKDVDVCLIFVLQQPQPYVLHLVAHSLLISYIHNFITPAADSDDTSLHSMFLALHKWRHYWSSSTRLQQRMAKMTTRGNGFAPKQCVILDNGSGTLKQKVR